MNKMAFQITTRPGRPPELSLSDKHQVKLQSRETEAVTEKKETVENLQVKQNKVLVSLEWTAHLRVLALTTLNALGLPEL